MFPPSYFAPTYWARTYWPRGGCAPMPGVGGVYFAPAYFPTSYLAPAFFPGDTSAADPVPVACGSDVLSRGVAWLAGRLQAGASQPVVYHRGGRRVALCATFGRTMLRLSDEYGTRIEWTDRDFLIPASALVLAGAPALPKRGDTLRHNDGTQVHTYEVLPYGDEPHWRWSDPYRTLIRVHTKHVKSEPA